jgi:tetratricopeptide (TPR) repeat protein
MQSLIFKNCGVVILLFSLECRIAAQSPPSQTRYQQVLSLIDKQQIQPAIDLLRKILEESPNEIKAHNLLGIALTLSGQVEEANAHFQKAIALNPRFYPALKNLAINEMALKRFDDARTHFSQAIQFGPSDPVAHLALGEIHFQKKQFPEAVKHYDQSSDLPFRNPRMALSYAIACLELNQSDKAAAVLEKLAPDADALIHFEAGLMYARMAKYDGAVRQFELARNGYPDPYEVTFNLALAYVKNRNYTAAIRTTQEFLSKGNQRAELYNLLSQAYEGNGQTIEAYNALRAATQLDPNDENNYLDLATLCVDHANYDLGLEIVNIGIKNIPRSDRLYFQRGTLLAMKGESNQAVADFETASKLAPERGLPYVARGIVLLELGEIAKAIDLIHQRVASNPNDYLVQYVLGEALNRSGPALGSAEENEAVQALEKSVLINPTFSASRAVLGKMLLRRNEVDRAIVQLEKALELDPTETSTTYQLALAYRKKGNLERAKELLAKVDRAKSESREQFMKHTLLRLVREGSQ